MKKVAISIAAAAATVSLISACGSSSIKSATSPATSSSASTTVGAHNAADVSFASDMIPHHAQAVQMADMALAKATNGQVKSLAQNIKAAQDPETVKMTGWLKTWSQPVPSTSVGAVSGMSTGMSTGMMSTADMASLDKATGAAFDRMWVQMMITHHQGAVTMSTAELASGQYTGAKTLAQSIVTSQTAQIGQLKTLLTQLPA